MSINPDNITTVRVDQLAESTLNLTNEFPHSEGATLKKATIQSLVDLVATAVGSGSGVGFLPISVTDGQQLPNVPTDPSFFLCGVGTFLNINGYPNIVCTEELNAIMSVSDHWEIAVEIPINVDLQSIGISQSVNNGVLDKAPSENAVYDFISQWLPKSSLGYFDYADLATQTTPITVLPNTQTLLTNDTLGDDTNTSQPPYGVTAIWDADSDEFNFSQLSVGDTVDLRIHLKTTTTTANQKYHVDMKFAFDGPSEFENRVFSQYVKTAGEDEQTFITTLYIGSEDVKNYPARLYITSDDDATVEVVGWFCRVFRKSVNIVDIITDEAPIDGLTYGRKDAEWVEVSGGGSTPDATTTVKGKLKLAGDLSGTADLPTVPELANKVDKNTAITGSTKTKITYDSKGLVTSGTDATTADIADSTNKRYVTDAQLVVIGNTSGTNTGDNATNTQYSGLATSKQDALTETNFGSFINSLTAKNTLVDADEVVSDDSADSNKAKKTSWLNVWDNYIKPKVTALISSATSNTVNKLIISTPSSNINSTSQTIVYSQLIPANTLPSSCVLDIDYRLVKTGVAGSWANNIHINTSNSLSGATVISTVAPSQSALIIRFQRTFNIHSGTLKGVSFTTNNIGYSDATTSTVAESSTSINVANDIYILVSVLPGSAVDTINGRHLRISW